MGEEWGGDAYDTFSHQEGIQFLKKQKYFSKMPGDAQVAAAFMAFMGEVANRTKESDYIATEGKDSASTPFFTHKLLPCAYRAHFPGS